MAERSMRPSFSLCSHMPSTSTRLRPSHPSGCISFVSPNFHIFAWFLWPQDLSLWVAARVLRLWKVRYIFFACRLFGDFIFYSILNFRIIREYSEIKLSLKGHMTGVDNEGLNVYLLQFLC